MELEKEVLELYKMLDYWKSEAKTQEINNAEENVKLRKQVRGYRMYASIYRVQLKHT